MQTITYEPFTAHFTGTLSVFHSADHKRWIFKDRQCRIEKGQAYMVKYNKEAGTANLLVVVPPNTYTGHAI